MDNRDNYRMDHRSPEQFAKDIEESTKIEKELIHRYVKYLLRKKGLVVSIEDNGCDNSGKLLSLEEVNTKADYKLNEKPVEVKFTHSLTNIIHLKVRQVQSYIEQNASILYVNGYNRDDPYFTIIPCSVLQEIAETYSPTFYEPWLKEVYAVPSQTFKWFNLGGREHETEEQ